MTTLTVGSGQQYTTIAAAVAAASTGDTINIMAGTYTNDFPRTINGLTLVGIGDVKLVATSQPPNGKAYLDVAGNTTLRNLDISGVTVADANGAAIRYESGNLVLDNVTVHGNQDGILGAADPTGTITIQNSEFYGNGTTTGSTHNIYIGDIASFTLTNSYIHDANTGHEVKSRAENNTIINNRIEDNSGTASYEIDLPNGGNANISGNTIQKSATSGNRVSIAYGEEGALHAGTNVSITGNTFVSDQSGATLFWEAGKATVAASGNVVYGYGAIEKSNQLGSNGFTTVTTRPNTAATTPTTTTPTTTTPTTTTPSTTTIAPTLVSAARADGMVTIRGTAQAGASVTLSDTASGKTATVGTTTAGNDGSWSITSASIGSAVVNRFAATASLGGGSPVASAGSLTLSGTAADKLTGTAGQSDVFAFTGAMGRDTVTNFETFAATGARHDVIDLSGTAYGSFTQLQSHISNTSAGAVLRFSTTNAITLTGVAANTLTASDFRFT